MNRNGDFCFHYLVAVSLGAGAQPTGLAVVEQETRRSDTWGAVNCALRVRHLERLPLGAGYPQAVDAALRCFNAVREDEQAERSRVLVDITGTGSAAMPLFRDAGLDPIGITITGAAGEMPVPDKFDEWRVSKATLVGGLQVAYQTDRLKMAEGVALMGKFKAEI